MVEGFQELEVEWWTFRALEGRLVNVGFSVLGGHCHLFRAHDDWLANYSVILTNQLQHYKD